MGCEVQRSPRHQRKAEAGDGGAGTGGLWVGVHYSGKAHGFGRGTDGTDTQNQRKLDVSELTETVSNYG